MKRLGVLALGGLVLASFLLFAYSGGDLALRMHSQQPVLAPGIREASLEIAGTGLRSCRLSADAHIRGFPKVISPCNSSLPLKILLPENRSRHRQLWNFELTAIPANRAEKALKASVKIAQSPEHRVAVFGDSFTYQMGLTEMALLRATQAIRSTYHAFPADGICNALPAIRRIAEEFRPEVAVLEYIGSNFDACAKTPRYGDPTVSPQSLQHWLVRQKEDFESAIDALRFAGVKKIYLDQGPHCDACNIFGPGTRATFAQLAKQYPRLVVVISPARAIEGRDRQIVSSLPCLPQEISRGECLAPSVEGHPYAQVRGGPDGFHVCNSFKPGVLEPPGCPTYSSGAFRYAAASVTPILKHWHLKPLPVFLPSAR